MANMGGFSVAGMKKLQKQLNKIQQGNVEAFIDACAKELAARLLAKVIKRTPVGQYPASSGKKAVHFAGAGLPKPWRSGKREKASAKAYADSLTIHHYGNTLVIEIVNPVEYASYVEYGHRTANHKGWVQGRFMLTISEQEIQNIAPKVLESKIKKFIGECLKW